ncbi:MAG: ribosome maturation factor RimP [Oscillospiraceae bacterium]
MAKKNSAQRCEELAMPLVEQMGLLLWDVRFEKEGGGWFLRFFIDKEGGVTIDDCEQFSHAIDPLLDDADPIEQSYCLEVSSPGIERELSRPRHFQESLGKIVLVRLIRARDGLRDITGRLMEYADGQMILETAGGLVTIEKKEAARVRLVDDYDYNKGATEGQ